MKIRIVRPTGRLFYQEDESERRALGREWGSLASPGTQLDLVRVARGVETIESDYDVELATPWVIQEVQRAEELGFDAAIILCMADPGLQGAREATRIPVVGVAQACYLTALALGHRFSILATGDVDNGLYQRCLRKYGLSEHLASVRCLGLQVHELRDDLSALKEAVLRVGAAARDKDGAEVIIPGCTRIYGVAAEAQAVLGVPVLDPVATGIRQAEMLVALGLAHSKRAFVRPLPKRRDAWA